LYGTSRDAIISLSEIIIENWYQVARDSHMLFETVYGPELERTYRLIQRLTRQNKACTQAEVYSRVVPNGQNGITKNAHDAITFLLSAKLLKNTNGTLTAVDTPLFRPGLFGSLRRVQADDESHPLDRHFMGLIEELFIAPDRVFRVALHAAVNRRTEISISQEKVNAWMRVLEHLGLGRRAVGGFQCVYAPGLLREILSLHPSGTYELDTFLSKALAPYLPVHARHGDLATGVRVPLQSLVDAGDIKFLRYQDSPARRYIAGYTHVRFKRRARGPVPSVAPVYRDGNGL